MLAPPQVLAQTRAGIAASVEDLENIQGAIWVLQPPQQLPKLLALAIHKLSSYLLSNLLLGFPTAALCQGDAAGSCQCSRTKVCHALSLVMS